VAGVDGGLVGEGEQVLAYGCQEGVEVTAGEVVSANGVGKEGVTGEDGGGVGFVEADATGGVAWGGQDLELYVLEVDGLVWLEEVVGLADVVSAS